jgi:chorismate mutase/prephenate dehydratase
VLLEENNVKHKDTSSNGKTGSHSLDSYREQIDKIDSQLISLLSKRQDVAADVGRIKRELGIEIFDYVRENNILKSLTANPGEYLTEDMIRHIFNEILSASRSVQAPLSVAFLGPEATFSHQAAVSLFGHSASLCAADAIEDVFSMVEKGVCHNGVVPIENSYEGSVSRTLDLFYKYNLKINAEIRIRIRHHLISKHNNISEIKQLYSHPMAIAQCRAWIKNYLPGISIKEVESTAHAATMAVDVPGSAAVGSRLSALAYDLNILAENIEDSPDNVTRFLGIGKKDTKPTGNDNTSILFFLKHQPGALYNALGVLAKRGINMSRIESRPIKTRKWEYLFFVDLDGHERDSNMHDALEEMNEFCVVLKRLGSYPVAGDPWD